MFFLYVYCEHRDLHVLTHSFPTLRSSDLLATRWRGHDDVVDRLPARDRGRIAAEALEQPQGAGGETVAAELVAGARGLVPDADAPPGAPQRDRPRRPRPSPTDDGDAAGVRRRVPHQIPTPGTSVPRPESSSAWPSGTLRVRGVGTTLQLPDWLSLRSVCSAVAWGDEYSGTVRLVSV